ncbi:hypothetical protein HK097_011591 [Rhizophlyctis rosea]|uniref:Uncharacterized protein n=1 Tax=Rhizophlyctis rosea TaxID=64517 RepID=A0AAD5S8P5_9FUNG|nr:hypothetical protein HK097_011591 [Rhizophlyctis rosea]
MRTPALLSIFALAVNPAFAQISEASCGALIDTSLYNDTVPTVPLPFLKAALEDYRYSNDQIKTIITNLSTLRSSINGTANIPVCDPRTHNTVEDITAALSDANTDIYLGLLRIKRVGGAALVRTSRGGVCANQTEVIQTHPKIQKKVTKFVEHVDKERDAFSLISNDLTALGNEVGHSAAITVRSVKTRLGDILSSIRQQKEATAEGIDLLRDIIGQVKGL